MASKVVRLMSIVHASDWTPPPPPTPFHRAHYIRFDPKYSLTPLIAYGFTSTTTRRTLSKDYLSLSLCPTINISRAENTSIPFVSQSQQATKPHLSPRHFGSAHYTRSPYRVKVSKMRYTPRQHHQSVSEL